VFEEASVVVSPAVTMEESAQSEQIAGVRAQIALVPVSAPDEDFLYRTYASTRADEMALTGWNPEQQNAFLRMQFNLQTRSYSTDFPEAEYSIIEWNGQPAGRWIVNRAADELLLVDIGLLPEFRGKGIGSELMNQLMEEARTTNKSIRLYVERFNPALAWYDRLGFRAISEGPVYLEMTWKSGKNDNDLESQCSKVHSA
jgi:ribosomal protein S18 acetylase RimI-like enzyme